MASILSLFYLHLMTKCHWRMSYVTRLTIHSIFNPPQDLHTLADNPDYLSKTSPGLLHSIFNPPKGLIR
jgi:hypothetical protein